MPFVNIQILKGRTTEQRDEIARRVTDAITDVTRLPPDAVWVVFEEVETEDWYAGGRSVKAQRAQKG